MNKIINLVGVVALALVVALVTAQEEEAKNGDLKFNCNRPGAKCHQENSTCDASTGQCVCEDGFGHYDCRYNQTLVVDCGQTLVCLEEGICTSYADEDETMELCECQEQYLEPDCSQNRVSFECAHDSVKVTVVPAMGDGAFQGLIYVKDHALTEECKLTEVQDRDGAFEASLSYDSCGEAFDFVNAENKTTRGFTLIVAYGGEIITDLDESVNIYCIFPQNGENVEASLDAIAKGVDQAPIEAGSKEKNLSPLEVKFLDGDGNEVDPEAPREIGAETDIQFNLNAGDLFSAYRIERIVAHNGKEEPTEINMVEDGCVPKAFDYLVEEFTETDDGLTKNLKYKQFKFLDSEKIVFKYIVRFCDDEMSGKCNKTECNAADHLTDPAEKFSAGRRKRQAGEEGVEVRELETSIRVQLPTRFGLIPQDDDTTFEPSGNDDFVRMPETPEECRCNVGYVIVVVVLAVLLVLLGTLSLVLCVRSQDRQRKGTGAENSFKN